MSKNIIMCINKLSNAENIKNKLSNAKEYYK